MPSFSHGRPLAHFFAGRDRSRSRRCSSCRPSARNGCHRARAHRVLCRSRNRGSAGPMQVAARSGPAPGPITSGAARNAFGSQHLHLQEIRAPRPSFAQRIRFSAALLPATSCRNEAQRAASPALASSSAAAATGVTNHHVVEAARERDRGGRFATQEACSPKWWATIPRPISRAAPRRGEPPAIASALRTRCAPAS